MKRKMNLSKDIDWSNAVLFRKESCMVPQFTDVSRAPGNMPGGVSSKSG